MPWRTGANLKPVQVVLLIPTPAASLNQRLLEDLTSADQIIVACGRYEGVDARVAEHYPSMGLGECGSTRVLPRRLRSKWGRGGPRLALVEEEVSANRRGRWKPDYPSSKVSLGSGAAELSGLQTNGGGTVRSQGVLFSGDRAGRIARWRRDRALEKAATRRPDMIEKLLEQPSSLDKRDREVLARRNSAPTS